MKVHCYHSPIPNSGAEPIIELWRESWTRHGWEPVILSEPDAARLPFYEALVFHTRRLPTINDWRYERACYLRWLAMAGISGGLLTDYDVINFGFKPSDLPPYDRKLIRLNRQSPCAVYGRLWNYLAIVDMFLSYNPQPDDLFGNNLLVQDMTIMNRYPQIADYHDLCSEYRHGETTANSPLIHFCTAGLPKDAQKADVIRDYMKARQ